MNVYDFVLIAITILGGFRGYRIGFVRQLGSTLGLVGGIGVSTWLTGLISPHLHGAQSKTVTTFVILVLAIVVCMLVGELIALRIKTATEKKWAHHIDNSAGAGISSITLLLLAWFAGSLWLLGPASSWQNIIQDSAIQKAISTRLPEPSNLLRRANALIEKTPSKKVFVGTEPAPNLKYPVPGIDVFASVRAKSQQATAKILGFGCGGIATGTGFFVDQTHVVTNAHVVSGVAHPKVVDSTGRLHNATAVVFSPENDIAVLRIAERIQLKSLRLDLASPQIGTQVLLPGYPGGGAFTEKTGVLAEKITAAGRDIYGQKETIRKVVALQAHVVQGNSGGPVIDIAGNVVGVVFSTSTTYNNVGYALSNEQVAREILRSPQAKPVTIPPMCSQE